MVSTAARLHEQAAALSTEPDLAAARRLDAASAWWFTSQPQRTLDVLGPMLDEPLDAVRRAEVALRHHTAQAWLGSAPDAAHRLLDEAERVRPVSDHAAVALACAATGTAALAADLRLAEAAAEIAVGASGAAPRSQPGGDDASATMATTALAFARLIGGRRLDPRMAATFDAMRRLPLDKLTDDQLDMVQFVGFALLVDEQTTEALEVLEGLRREAVVRGVSSAGHFAAAIAAEAYRRRGEWTIADARAMPDSDDERTTTASDLGLSVRARVRAYQGLPDATEPARIVLERADRVGLGYVAALARAAVAAADLTADDAEGALTHLDRIEHDVERGGGHDTGTVWYELDRLAARPWADLARRLTPHRPERAGPGRDLAGLLSPAELRVALAVAGGRSNAETATELHLSPRTVEAHLRTIFRKLGVRNRTALATLVLRTFDDTSLLDRFDPTR